MLVNLVQFRRLHFIQALFPVNFLKTFDILVGLVQIRLDGNVDLLVQINICKACWTCVEGSN